MIYLKGGDVLTPGLVDGHTDIINVVDTIEELQGTERVALHLRIIGRIYEDSKTVLVIACIDNEALDLNLSDHDVFVSISPSSSTEILVDVSVIQLPIFSLLPMLQLVCLI